MKGHIFIQFIILDP